MGVSGHTVNLPCSLDLSVCFCYVSRATPYTCKDRQKGLGGRGKFATRLETPTVRTPPHLLYIQSRVLNIRFCTRLMGQPFFFCAVRTYRVLPYSMIAICTYKSTLHVGMETQKSNQTRYYTAMLLRITIPTSNVLWNLLRMWGDRMYSCDAVFFSPIHLKKCI